MRGIRLGAGQAGPEPGPAVPKWQLARSKRSTVRQSGTHPSTDSPSRSRLGPFALTLLLLHLLVAMPSASPLPRTSPLAQIRLPESILTKPKSAHLSLPPQSHHTPLLLNPTQVSFRRTLWTPATLFYTLLSVSQLYRSWYTLLK